MKVRYDKRVDAAYIQLSSKKPDGAIEMAEGVILHTTSKNEIVAIEILDATRKIPIKTLYKLEVTPATVYGRGDWAKTLRLLMQLAINTPGFYLRKKDGNFLVKTDDQIFEDSAKKVQLMPPPLPDPPKLWFDFSAPLW